MAISGGSEGHAVARKQDVARDDKPMMQPPNQPAAVASTASLLLSCEDQKGVIAGNKTF